MGLKKPPGARTLIPPGLFIYSSRRFKKGGVRPPPPGGRIPRGPRQLPGASGRQEVAKRPRIRQGPPSAPHLRPPTASEWQVDGPFRLRGEVFTFVLGGRHF